MAETLEDKIESKESKGFIRKALNLGFNVGMAGLTTALSIPFSGASGILVGGALAAGGFIGRIFKKNKLYQNINESLKQYSSINAIYAPIQWLASVTYPLIPIDKLAGKIARSLYALTAYNAAFVASYNTAYHLIDKKFNPTGIGKSVFGNLYNQGVRIGSAFSPGYIADALEITPFGLSPYFFNAPFVGFYNAVKPVAEPKKSPARLPEYSPSMQPAH